MPSYYSPSGKPLNQTRGLAADIRAEFQLVQAGFNLLPIPAAVVGGYANYSADTGAADAYVLTLGSAVTGYVDGLTVMFKAGAANTGAATVNVNALGLKTITRSDGSVLQAGDILAGQIVQISYSTTNGKFQLLASGAAVSALSSAASALSASNSASAASGSAIAASGSASNASTSASNAALSATAAANYAAALSGTSASSVLIGIGAKSFAASTAKQWSAGQFLAIVSAANNANYMHGQVTSYDAGTGELAINVLDFDGAGTFAGWLITVAGTQGPRGLTAVSSVAPKQLITAAVTQAVAGGAYALANATAQGAATNLMLYSNALNNPAWAPIGTANAVPNSDWDYAGNLQAVSLALPTLGDRLYSPTISVSASTAYAASIWLRGSGVIYLAGVVSGGAGMNFASPITLTSTLTRYSVTLTTPAGATSLFVMIGTFNPSTGPAGTATGAYVSGVQVETGSVATSNIPTTSAPVTRPAGVIAPQRIVLPVSPNSNDAINVIAANGSAENIIDPNGQQFYGPSGPLAGPLKLDSKNAAVDLQFINGYWRSI